MNSNEVTILTDAILELYLAIKIRSSEEVSTILLAWLCSLRTWLRNC